MKLGNISFNIARISSRHISKYKFGLSEFAENHLSETARGWDCTIPDYFSYRLSIAKRTPVHNTAVLPRIAPPPLSFLR